MDSPHAPSRPYTTRAKRALDFAEHHRGHAPQLKSRPLGGARDLVDRDGHAR